MVEVNVLIAFGAGLLSFFAPCVVPLLPMSKMYDVIVIGGGSAGFCVLEQITKRGLRIALVENRKPCGDY